MMPLTNYYTWRTRLRARLGDVTRSYHANAFSEHWLEELPYLGTLGAFGELTRAHRGRARAPPGVVSLPGTFLTSASLRSRTTQGGLLRCENRTVLLANLPSSKSHELRPFEVRGMKLISWNLVKNWLGNELWRVFGSQLGGVRWQRRCTSEKPCLEWNENFFWWIPNDSYVIAAWRHQSEIILRMGNPRPCGEIRNGNCMLKIIWKGSAIECPSLWPFWYSRLRI